MARKKSNRTDFDSASAPYGGAVGAPTPHSGLDHWPSTMQKAGGPKAEMKTPWSYNKVNSGPYHPGIGNPRGVNKPEQKTPMTHFKPVPHSDVKVPVEPKKWHKKGYTMGMDD